MIVLNVLVQRLKCNGHIRVKGKGRGNRKSKLSK